MIFPSFFGDFLACGEAALAADLITAWKPSGEAALAANLITAFRAGRRGGIMPMMKTENLPQKHVCWLSLAPVFVNIASP